MRAIDTAKRAVPKSARTKMINARVSIRRRTSGLRSLPDFLVIGAQRSGTSSLFRYLGEHPLVVPSIRKETEYLSRKYSFGLDWYRAHFPSRLGIATRAKIRGGPLTTFEATPDYLFYPLAPARAASLLPEAKLVVLLRDPVERAFSHHKHMVRLGFEDLPFEEALAAEPERLRPDLEALREDPLHYARPYLRFSYVSRGRYEEQLARWFEHYPRDRFLILKAEEFFEHPGAVYGRVLSFLGLPAHQPRIFANHSYPEGHPDHGSQMAPAVRRRLAEMFEPHNQRLYTLLGRDFGWETLAEAMA